MSCRVLLIEGYPCARVTLASELKLALKVYKQIPQVGLPYHPGPLDQLVRCVSSCVTSIVTSKILEIKIDVLYGKHVKFTNKRENIIITAENTLYCSDVYNLAQKLDNSVQIV